MKTAKRNDKTLLLLLKDDDERFFMRKQLLEAGYGDVRSAALPYIAEDILSEEKISLLIIDAHLADEGGMRLLRRLRDSKRAEEAVLPVIMVTASMKQQCLVEAVRIGINSCAVKPVSVREIVARIDQACARPDVLIIKSVADQLERSQAAANSSAKPSRPPKAQADSPPASPKQRSKESKPSNVKAVPRPAAPPAEPVKVHQRSESKPRPAAQPPRRIERPVGDTPVQRNEPDRIGGGSIEVLGQDGEAAKADRSGEPEFLDADDVVESKRRTSDFEIEVKETNGKAAKPDRGLNGSLQEKVDEIIADHAKWLASSGQEGKRASFNKGTFSAADFSEADLRNADFRHADLSDSDFRKADVEWADFRYANMVSVNFNETNARGARLRHANLSLAFLEGAIFKDADLTGAVFKDAQLARADLTDANLMGTDFSGVDLAKVQGLVQAQFNKAVSDSSTAPPTGIIRVKPDDGKGASSSKGTSGRRMSMKG